MKKIPNIVLMLVLMLVLDNCSTSKPTPQIPPTAPIAEAGKDLRTAVAEATQTYIDIKKGDTGIVWSIKKGIDAYQLWVKTKADVKQLTTQWGDGTAAGKKFSEKLATLFGAATGTPQQKAAELSEGVSLAAQNNGP